MSLLHRRLSPVEFDWLIRQLGAADAPPEERHLRCLGESRRPPGACDWMHASLWQDRRTGELWVHYAGGIAHVDLWYGPGAPALADRLSEVSKDHQHRRAAAAGR